MKKKSHPNKIEAEYLERIVTEYLIKFPDAPSQTIAKAIHKEHPLLGNGVVDNIRGAIRTRRGSHGPQSRISKPKYKKFPNPGGAYVPFPEESQEITLYKVPTGNTKLGYISDVHVPHQCNQTLDMAYNDWTKRGVDTIIINGDLLDNPTFGKHPFDPSWNSKTKEWMDRAEYFLENLRDNFPNALILFTEGNHDFWYKRHLWTQAKNLITDPYYSLEERLHLMDYKVKFIPQTELVHMADYFIFHGHMHIKGGQLDTAVKRLARLLNSNCMIGHIHYASSFTEYDILQRPAFTCHISGCASTVFPAYKPFGGKARKGYINSTVIDGKHQVENIWNDNGTRKIITI